MVGVREDGAFRDLTGVQEFSGSGTSFPNFGASLSLLLALLDT